jgi:hypothetical protein
MAHPGNVHHGRPDLLRRQEAQVVEAAYADHSERFVRKPVPCQNWHMDAELALYPCQDALLYSLIRPPMACLRSMRAVTSMAWPGSCKGGRCCRA